MTEPSEDIEQARRNLLRQQAWLTQQATRHALELIAQRQRMTRLEAIVVALVVVELLRWLVDLAR